MIHVFYLARKITFFLNGVLLSLDEDLLMGDPIYSDYTEYRPWRKKFAHAIVIQTIIDAMKQYRLVFLFFAIQ